MLNLGHKKLTVWQKSLLTIKEVYRITSLFPSEEKFGLISQSRRASVSIAANIAEGASRKSAKDRKHFYEISRSSLVELDTHFTIALELCFIDLKELNQLSPLVNEVFAMLSGMINKTK